VDFTAVLYKVHQNKEGDLMAALDKFLGGASSKDDMDMDDDGEEFHAFVLLKFEP
jgi:V-type H+-transporting ATPase subunit C